MAATTRSRWSPNSGPFWTDLLLADFDRDGFDDVFQFHGSSLTGGGFAFLTAVDVDDPGKGTRAGHLPRHAERTRPRRRSGGRRRLQRRRRDRPRVAGGQARGWQPGVDRPALGLSPSRSDRARNDLQGRVRPWCRGNTSQIGPRAIATDLRLEWPDLDCSGCPTSTYGFGLAAGNFDGRLAADSGFEKDELALVRSDIHAGTSTLWAYRFDASLKPDGAPKKTDVTSHVVPNQKLFLAGGRVNQFRAADQIAVVSGSFSNTRLAVLQFDSDLTVHARSIDVLRDAFNSKLSKGGFPFPQGATIGRFDPQTSGGTTEDFNSQIAALYEVNDTVNGRLSTVVQIYSLAEGSTAKPKLRSEHKLLDGRYLEGVLAHYAPLEAGDLRGRSLLLGRAEHLPGRVPPAAERPAWEPAAARRLHHSGARRAPGDLQLQCPQEGLQLDLLRSTSAPRTNPRASRRPAPAGACRRRPRSRVRRWSDRSRCRAISISRSTSPRSARWARPSTPFRRSRSTPRRRPASATRSGTRRGG